MSHYYPAVRPNTQVILNYCIFHFENNLSNYSKALEYFEQSLEIKKEIGDRKGEAKTLGNIGVVYRDISHPGKAIEYFEKDLVISREIEDKRGEGHTLGNLGIAYRNLGEYEQALEFFEKSLEIKNEQGDRRREAQTLRSMGNVYSDLFDFQKALDYFNNSLTIYMEVGDKRGESQALGNIGVLLLRQKRNDEAEEYFHKALAIALELKSEELISNEFMHLGDCFYNQEKYVQAVEKYKQSINSSEQIRGKLAVEIHKTSFMTGVVETYSKLIRVLLIVGKKDEAFQYLERMKARTLLDILEGGKIDFSEVMTSDESLMEKLLISKLENFNEQIAGLKKDEEFKLDSLSILRDTKRSELESFEEKLYLTHTELKEDRGRGEPINLKKAKRMLNRNEAAVYFLTTEEQLFTFVLTRKTLEVVSRDIVADTLNSYIENLISGLSSLDWDQEIAEKLYDHLLQPIEYLLEGKEMICIIPDGKLHYLPFQALKNRRTGRYLMEDFALYYTPSLSTLFWLRVQGTLGGRELLAFGDCNFHEEATLSATRGELVSLPATAFEVKALEEVYHPKVRVLTTYDATESNFKKFSSEYGVLHLATHALVNETSPLYSSIAFTKEEGEDGFLEAREIMQMELNADLAVLSACKTAFGKQVAGEGMLGLTRAFFTAGVPSVVASLWSVEDNATKELMVQFHTRLRDGERPAVALNKAQNYLIKNTKYSSPVFWSPFILIGDSE